VVVADWATDAVQAQHVRVRVGRDAKVTHMQVSLGGDLVRQYTSVEYTGRGGDVELYGLYFADAGQHLEHRQLVDHSVPDCRSYVGYRGALQGEGAHTVWVGDVLIQVQATGTDTYEINRNLVLSDGARADSVPNLEIETGEVAGAGHASATGRFDDEQLFYLMARGIPEGEARKLVVRGFFAELVNKIPVEGLRERLGDAIEARLQKAGA
jgi:Fe-S cluster assembly protein SufD